MKSEIIQQYSELLFYHASLAIGGIIVLSVLAHMLYQRRSPTAIIAWILSIILIPYIALVLYFIIGSRKRKNRYKKSNLQFKNSTNRKNVQNSIEGFLKNYAIADAATNERFELYTDAASSYKALLNAIENAKDSIYISTYIFNYDPVTEKIIQALAHKAKEGVRVKILIDSLGSIMLYFFAYRLKELREAGADIRFFMPLIQMPFRNYINLRNHRKIFLFDNKSVLSGGANLSDEYLGAKHDKKRWQDVMFIIKGGSVEHYFDIFASDWYYASGEKLYFNRQPTVSQGDILLQIVPSGPDVEGDPLYESLLSAIYNAKKHIYIVTPYFIPNKSLIEALIIAHHKGVEIKLITPKEANHTIVNLVRSSYMRELEEAGIKIYLYSETMLHAKAIIFDDTCAVLGSVNFDNRSLFLNYEVATFIYSQKVIQEVCLWAQKLQNNSSLGTKSVGDAQRVFENLMRVLAPQL